MELVPQDTMNPERDQNITEILYEFEDVFKEELPVGLPQQRAVDHEIWIDPDSCIPYRGLYKLSTEELRATKEYPIDLLKQKVIKLSRSPFGAPLFFVKTPRKGRTGVVEYRVLN